MNPGEHIEHLAMTLVCLSGVIAFLTGVVIIVGFPTFERSIAGVRIPAPPNPGLPADVSPNSYRVEVGDVWECVGTRGDCGCLVPDPRNVGTYVVEAANVNTEAGPDSWLMRRVGRGDGAWFPDYSESGALKYMHRPSRMRGEWVRRAPASSIRWIVPAPEGSEV